MKHEVIALDIDKTRVQLLQQRKSPIQDELIELYLAKDIDFQATIDSTLAYANAEVIIVATPTNYDEQSNYFDTNSIEQVLKDLNHRNSQAIIVIKSTIPVGFTQKCRHSIQI